MWKILYLLGVIIKHKSKKSLDLFQGVQLLSYLKRNSIKLYFQQQNVKIDSAHKKLIILTFYIDKMETL